MVRLTIRFDPAPPSPPYDQLFVIFFGVHLTLYYDCM